MLLEPDAYSEIVRLITRNTQLAIAEPEIWPDIAGVRDATNVRTDGLTTFDATAGVVRSLERLLNGSSGFPNVLRIINTVHDSAELEWQEQFALYLWNNSRLLREMPRKHLASPEKLVTELRKIRPSVIEELNQRRKEGRRKTKRLALVSMVAALIAGGRITDRPGRFRSWAKGRDLFDRSKILQSERMIDASHLATPEALLRRITELLPLIRKEQHDHHRKPGHGCRGKKTAYVHSTVINALISGGRIRRNAQSYRRLAGGGDLWTYSPTLRSVMDDDAGVDVEDNGPLMRFLLARRDRIAIEALVKQKKIKRHETLIYGIENHFALGTLVWALFAGGAISSKRAAYLNSQPAPAIQYYWNQQDIIRDEVLRAIEGMRNGCFSLLKVDRSLFASRKKPRKANGTPQPVSKGYLSTILWWSLWFLTAPEVVTRSIYDAQELAILARAPHFIPDRPNLVPKRIGRRLDAAARRDMDGDPYGARRDAVGAMQGILDHHARKRSPLDGVTRRYLRNVGRIVDWNRDALSAPCRMSAAANGRARPTSVAFRAMV